MPVINLNKERVLRLLGKKVSDEVLREKISYLGTDLEEIKDDEIVVEVFPNRPDLLSEEGFGRALKSFLGFEQGLRKYDAKKSNFEVVIDGSVGEVRPFTACLVAKNLVISEEVLEDIINLQEKLHVTYGRNRKKCAIGVYPLDSVVFPVHYKALSPEKIVFVPLGESKEMNGFDLLKKTKAGKEYGFLLEKEKKFPVFVDSSGSVMSVPPILNSRSTGTVSTSTKDLFVECSGHDFDVLSKALNMIGSALVDMGADVFSVTLKYGNKKRVTPEFAPKIMSIETAYINKYLGLGLSENELSSLLERMGFGIKKKSKKSLEVFVPCFRADILHPVDLVEDVCIAFGFDNVRGVKDDVHSVGKELFVEKVKEKIRDVFVGDGLLEVMNYSLVKLDDQKRLGLDGVVKIKNPNSSEYNSMRKFLFPVVLKTFKANKMNEYPQSVFELGTVFGKHKILEEHNSLCVATCSDNASFTWAKQRLELLGRLFGLEFKVERKDFDFFIKGRSAEVLVKKKSWESVGFIGEASLETLRLFDLERGVSLFELNLDSLSALIEEKQRDA